MTLYEKALALATEAHKGQTDKAGQDYILHPLAVAESVSTQTAKIVALLHDTVEDAEVSLDDIKLVFGETVAEAVDALTRRDGEEYFKYLERVKANPLAKEVKLADLKHNMDLSRLKVVTIKDLQRIRKYEQAKEFLERQ
jgi:(p)ppGpp synthase/HD superfamily hydrolase